MKRLIAFSFQSHLRSPSMQRMNSILAVFKELKYSVVLRGNMHIFRYVFFSLIKKQKHLFLFSGPPYTPFLLSLIFPIKIIYDFRDGWSIATISGYGGTVRPSTFKYFIIRFIEYLVILKSSYVLVATPGLYRDLRNIEKRLKTLKLINKRKIILHLNGFIGLHSNYMFPSRGTSNHFIYDKDINLICLGKFWEYGISNCKNILDSILSDFPNSNILIDIYGSSYNANPIVPGGLEAFHIKYKARISDCAELDQTLRNYDYGIFVLRDMRYDYGTKVFDYVGSNISPYLPKSYENSDIAHYLKPLLRLISKNSSEASLIRLNYSRKKQKDILLKNIKLLKAL
jgi:hypothetical protein